MAPILITKNDCPNCVAVKRRLTKNGIPVEERNVDLDPSARELATAAGLMSAPALNVDDVWYRTMGQILDWIRGQR